VFRFKPGASEFAPFASWTDSPVNFPVSLEKIRESPFQEVNISNKMQLSYTGIEKAEGSE